MTETTELPTTSDITGGSTAGAAKGGLSGMVLPDLKALAGRLGIKGTSGMRKGDLVAAIAAHQAGTRPAQQHPDRDRPTTPNGSAGDTPASAVANGSDGSGAANGSGASHGPADTPESGNGRADGGAGRSRRVATRRTGAPSLTPNRPSPRPCRPPIGQNLAK